MEGGFLAGKLPRHRRDRFRLREDRSRPVRHAPDRSPKPAFSRHGTNKQGRRVDAWASRADEGRGNAAISPGQVRATVAGDLRMGQPRPGHAGRPLVEHIDEVEATGGTETSQYPEERKVLP